MKGIWKYSDLLPSVKPEARITLGEGNTPLIRSRQLGSYLGLENLFFKLEMVNPSGSYKDRFAAAAIGNLVQKDIKFCIATSSGNTGAALAAYCAAAGIKCYLAIVDGAPSGKLQQMKVYGAETLTIKNFGIDAQVTNDVMNGLEATAAKYGGAVQISAFKFSPLGMAGVQTISYEIAEEFPSFSGNLFSPAGGGGLALAIAKGFERWRVDNDTFNIPKVHCVQPIGNNTISGPLRNGMVNAAAVARCTSSISGLQVPNIIDGNETVSACRATGGNGYLVTDDLVYESQQNLALKEGVFCEPAGAVALAGLVQALKNGEINKKDPVICVITGHGFKDPVSAARISERYAGQYFENVKDTFSYLEPRIKN